MKKILFMAATPEGFIAREDGSVDWSQDHWRNYFELCKSTGYLAVGNKTYQLMLEEGEIAKLEIKKLIVITSQQLENTNNHYFFNSPETAINFLEKEGTDQVVIGGGGKLNASILEAGLIDEIQIDIEPRLFGQGYPLFELPAQDYQLELLESFQSGSNTVRVRYKVIYS